MKLKADLTCDRTQAVLEHFCVTELMLTKLLPVRQTKAGASKDELVYLI